MERREQREDGSAYQDIVEVRDYKVGIVHLDVDRNGRQHDAREAAKNEDKDEPEDEVHGSGQSYSSGPKRCEPAEDLNATGDCDHHARCGEVSLTDLRQSGREHM